jgi:hypothetical protein
MLCSRPARAQPPIVEAAKWTFVAARIACASDRVIQSAAEGIGQSEVRAGGLDGVPDFDGLEVSVDGSPVEAAAGTAGVDPGSVAPDPASDPDDPDPDPDEPSSSPPVEDLDLMAARRSFFAQPEPR